MTALSPTTLTYLFSDLEASTRLWERHPDAMHEALARHDAILRAAVEGANGTVVKTTGDGMMAVFGSAPDAVAASLDAQRRLRDEPWGDTGSLRVRMGMHVGEAQPRAGDYYGPAVNRAARIMSAAHGGQILLSGPAAALVAEALPADASLRDLGTHRLKDLAGPEQLFQVLEPGLQDTFPALATLDLRPNNLPTQTSVFLGRLQPLAHLRALLDTDDVRLVTMTGPGGTGKTRLALQAAADQIDRFEDGVFFVDLAAEREPDAAYSAIVRAIGLGGTGEDPPLEALKRDLRERQMLLVLDNFEQVTDAATGVAELLQSCPRVTALVTSREGLRVRGERLFPVPPLSLPSSTNGKLSVKDAVESEAVRLFVERAIDTRPDFEITEGNAGAVAAVCTRLDGLPLAIELAAARMNLFTVDELRQRLEERLDLLRGGARDLPARQQTLWSTIEWSNELLSPEERTLLQLLSVFAGGRLGAVEETVRHVAALSAIDVIDGLASLVDKSLVRNVEDSEGRPRFAMLQTIREYAADQLDVRADLAHAVRQAHAEHFTQLAVDLRQQLAERGRDQVLDEISSELGNLRTAWDHWAAEGNVPRLNDLIDSLWGYYDARGDYGAAVELANDLLGVLALEPETPERVRDEIALQMSLARTLLAVRGYTAEVEETIRAAIVQSEGAGNIPQRFPVLRSLATLHMLRADYGGAIEVGRELLVIADQQQDPALQSDAHLVYGANVAFSEDMEEGLRHLDQAIEHFDRSTTGLVRFRVGPSPGVVSRTTSALLLWMLGFPDRAVSRAARALEVARTLDHPYSTAFALHHVATLDLWRQELGLVQERANELLQVANAHDYPIWRALALVLQGTARVGLGEPEEGLAQVERGFTLYQGLTTPPVFWPLLLTVRAGACAMAGRTAEVHDILDEAMAALPEGDSMTSGILLMRGDVLMSPPSPDAAQAAALYLEALAISQDMGLRMDHLQAATRLAAMRRGTPHEAEARADLREIFDTFTEGLDAAPLVAARAVLEGA